MLIWVIFAVLTAAVVAAMIQPFAARSGTSPEPEAADLAVYRDQLAEIEADKDRGLIGAAEAASARTEVARRLLHRADQAKASRSDAAGIKTLPGSSTSQMALRLTVAAIPLASLALYVAYGSPQLPGTPIAGRASATTGTAPVIELITRVEKRLLEHPEDGQGWDVIAPIYLKLQRYGDAAESYGNALRLLGETPNRLAGFAEASFLANNGVVSEIVRTTAERLLVVEPGRADGQFWLALSKEQDGAFPAALEGYRKIAMGTAPESQWREFAKQRINAVEAKMPGQPEPVPKPSAAAGAEASQTGPTAQDIDAAAQMSEAERGAFIEQMTARLAARLAVDGKDAGGWTQLMRAYMVLGKKDDAAKALADAKRNLAGDDKALADIETAAKAFGIGS